MPEFERQPINVRPGCDGLAMNDSGELGGIELRYVLTMQLFLHGPASIAELLDGLAWHGFCVRGRASKAVSDALRWEIGRRRAVRLTRGWYGPGRMPRGTEYRIHARVMALREQAERLSLKPGHKYLWPVLDAPEAAETGRYS